MRTPKTIKTPDLNALMENMERKRDAYYAAKYAYNKAYEKSLNIDFQYKFIRIGSVNEEPEYLFVKEQFRVADKYSGAGDYFVLRGFGFRCFNSPYPDASYFDWDWMYEHKLYINNMLKENLRKITEITKEEFRDKLMQGFGETMTHIEEIFGTNYFNQKREE